MALSSPMLTSAPLIDGLEFHKDLLHGEVICRSVRIPHDADRVLIKASVVGLTGNPNLFGGWDEKAIMDRVQSDLAPPNSGGYHILYETTDVPSDRTSYYLCVTSFSTQGSDYLLTASITDANDWLPNPITLMDGYPTVWRIDGKDSDYTDFVLPVVDSVANRNVSVSVTPLFGEVDLRVSDCSSWTETLAVSAAVGPDVLSVPIPAGSDKVCIRVHTSSTIGNLAESEFSIVASTDPNGPFLAQSVPVAGHPVYIAKMRAYFNQGTDLSFTSRWVTGGGDAPKLTVDTVPGGSAWHSLPSSPGRLDIDRSALSGREGDLMYISTSSAGEKDATDGVFQVVLTTHGSVEELQDGIPVHVTVDSEVRFRDFRVWIPRTAKLITIQADSSVDGSGLGIFASTVRTSHDPRGYRWNTMTGTNEILLTTDESLVNEKIQFVNCQDCYVYLSVKSCVVRDGVCRDEGVSQFTVSAGSDTGVSRVEAGRTTTALAGSDGKKFLFTRPTTSDAVSDGENEFVYVTAHSGDVEVSLHATEPVSTESYTGTACASESRCKLTISSADAIRKSENLFILVRPTDVSTVSQVDVVVRPDSIPEQLRNHHPVSGTVSKGSVEKFKFFVPSSPSVDAMVALSGSPDVTIRVCMQASCQSITGSGIIHVKPGDVAIELSTDSESPVNFQLSPSFFSSVSNSLRVGYNPVSVAVEPATKISFQVGYYEDSEWMLGVNCDAGSMSMCIDDGQAKPRCRDLPAEPLQGFGRQLVWVENTGTTKAVASVVATPLTTLKEGVETVISDRKSEIFKMKNWPTKIVTDGSVQWTTGGPDGDRSGTPPADDTKEAVFAIVSGGTKARLVPRHELYLNQWTANAVWSKYVLNELPGRVRVESCRVDNTDLRVNGQPATQGFVDLIDLPQSGEVDVATTGDFRVGLHSGPAVDFSLIQAGSGSAVVFTAPPNAAGSLYRSLCLSSAGARTTQCVIERSVDTIHGTPVACTPNSVCEVPIPDICDSGSSVTVAADKGTEFGLFQPVSFASGSSPTRSTTSWWRWLIKLVGFILVVRSMYVNRTHVRILVFRAINWFRNRSHAKGLLGEMNSVENGGYRAMKDVGNTYGSRLVHRPSSYHGGTELPRVAHDSFVYHGA